MINREIKAIDYLENEQLGQINKAALHIMEINGIGLYPEESRSV